MCVAFLIFIYLPIIHVPNHIEHPSVNTTFNHHTKKDEEELDQKESKRNKEKNNGKGHAVFVQDESFTKRESGLLLRAIVIHIQYKFLCDVVIVSSRSFPHFSSPTVTPLVVTLVYP